MIGLGREIREQVVNDWCITAEQLEQYNVLFHSYTYIDYSGSALTVLLDSNGQLWECNGSHCSCYGLEGQWSPEETSAEAMRIRRYTWMEEERPEEAQTLQALLNEIVGRSTMRAIGG